LSLQETVGSSCVRVRRLHEPVGYINGATA